MRRLRRPVSMRGSVARFALSLAALTLIGGLVARHTETASALGPCGTLLASPTSPSPEIRTLDCFEPDPTTLKPLSTNQLKQLDAHGIKNELNLPRGVDLAYDPETGGVYTQSAVPEYTGWYFPRAGGGPVEGPLPVGLDVPEVPPDV